MSTPHNPDVAQDASSGVNDGVNMKKIIAVGVVSLVVFALSTVASWAILRADTERLKAAQGLAGAPTQIGKDEIGLVDQIHFDADRRLQDWQAAKAKQLTTYGWSDRSKNLIHIPIDQAIEQVIAQAGGKTAPATPAPATPAAPAPEGAPAQ